jgi:hypothetical protein
MHLSNESAAIHSPKYAQSRQAERMEATSLGPHVFSRQVFRSVQQLVGKLQKTAMQVIPSGIHLAASHGYYFETRVSWMQMSLAANQCFLMPACVMSLSSPFSAQ